MKNLLELSEEIGVKGFLHCDELSRLTELAANRNVLEVGAFMGLSAWGMAITAKSVVSLDTFRANSAGQQQMPELTTLDAYTKAVSRFGNVRWHVGTSEQGAAAGLGDFDMIFLDAMHTYEDCLADIKRWWPRVAVGGVFAIHDYRHSDFPGVERAADEVFGPAPEGTTVVTLRWINKL